MACGNVHAGFQFRKQATSSEVVQFVDQLLPSDAGNLSFISVSVFCSILLQRQRAWSTTTAAADKFRVKPRNVSYICVSQSVISSSKDYQNMTRAIMQRVRRLTFAFRLRAVRTASVLQTHNGASL